MSSQTERALVYGPSTTVNVAVCRDDKCPWKHRGIAAAGTLAAAENHVRDADHEVTLYVEKRMTMGLA